MEDRREWSCTHWGLYQVDGHVKSQVKNMLPEAAPETVRQRSFRDVMLAPAGRASLSTPLRLTLLLLLGTLHGLERNDLRFTLSADLQLSWGGSSGRGHVGEPLDQCLV